MDLQREIDAIKASQFKRRFVEACLLATHNIKDISETLEVPEEVLVEFERTQYPYSRLTRLEKLAHVDSIQEPDERELKLWAVTQGFNFIKWRMGFKVELSPVDGMRELYADCIFKAKEAFFNSNSTESSKEAIRWVNQSTFIAKMIKAWVADSKEAMKDIELALESLDGHNTAFETLESIDDINVLNGMSDTESKYADTMENVLSEQESPRNPANTISFEDLKKIENDLDLMG